MNNLKFSPFVIILLSEFTQISVPLFQVHRTESYSHIKLFVPVLDIITAVPSSTHYSKNSIKLKARLTKHIIIKDRDICLRRKPLNCITLALCGRWRDKSTYFKPRFACVVF